MKSPVRAVLFEQLHHEFGEHALRQSYVRIGADVTDPTASGAFGLCSLGSFHAGLGLVATTEGMRPDSQESCLAVWQSSYLISKFLTISVWKSAHDGGGRPERIKDVICLEELQSIATVIEALREH
jgi:hypothetical protein